MYRTTIFLCLSIAAITLAGCHSQSPSQEKTDIAGHPAGPADQKAADAYQAAQMNQIRQATPQSGQPAPPK